MNFINDSNTLDEGVDIERTFKDEGGYSLQEIIEYLIKVLIENNSFQRE